MKKIGLPSHPSEVSSGLEKHQVYFSLTTSLFGQFPPSSPHMNELDEDLMTGVVQVLVGWLEHVSPKLQTFLDLFGLIDL